MRQVPFLRLGDGKTRRYPVSAGAAMLDRAAQAGLPTPPAIILLDEGWQRLLADEIIRLDGADIHVDGADILLRSFALHALPRPVAVRPLFPGSAEADLVTRLHVPPDDHHALIAALVAVWQAGALRPHPPRRDLLVMDMVAGTQSGVARLHPKAAEDHVHLSAAPGGRALEPGQALPRLQAWQRPTAPTPPLRRLQQLVRGLRRSLPLAQQTWRVAWVDDGATCWLWGIEPDAP